MLFSIFNKFKYPQDIVLFCTPRTGSHFYLTEIFSKFIIDNKLSHQIESGELFNPILDAWYNPKSNRIWSTEKKTGLELQKFTKKAGYQQLSREIAERIDQIAFYKNKHNIRLLYSLHPYHISEAENAIPFFKKQFVLGLERKNKIGQIYSWLRYRKLLENDEESLKAINWLADEIKIYETYKKELKINYELIYENLSLTENVKDRLLKISPKKLFKVANEKITVYEKLPYEDYKSSKYYHAIIQVLKKKKILDVNADKKRILVMGLPGSGKTTFADKLAQYLKNKSGKTVERINADIIRTIANDFDFSPAGRIRQCTRMFDLSWASEADFVICDFIAPTQEIRNSFSADWTILMDTIDSGRYEDTNKIFEYPVDYDMRVHSYDFDQAVKIIGDRIFYDDRRDKFINNLPTLLLTGNWCNLDENTINLVENEFNNEKQICFAVKQTENKTFAQIANLINKKFETKYQGRYQIIELPRINEIIDIDNLNLK